MSDLQWEGDPALFDPDPDLTAEMREKEGVSEQRTGYLTAAHTFGSHYDQADGSDIEHPAGTRVQWTPSDRAGKVWIKSPEGRESLAPASAISTVPPGVTVGGRNPLTRLWRWLRRREPTVRVHVRKSPDWDADAARYRKERGWE